MIKRLKKIYLFFIRTKDGPAGHKFRSDLLNVPTPDLSEIYNPRKIEKDIDDKATKENI